MRKYLLFSIYPILQSYKLQVEDHKATFTGVQCTLDLFFDQSFGFLTVESAFQVNPCHLTEGNEKPLVGWNKKGISGRLNTDSNSIKCFHNKLRFAEYSSLARHTIGLLDWTWRSDKVCKLIANKYEEAKTVLIISFFLKCLSRESSYMSCLASVLPLRQTNQATLGIETPGMNKLVMLWYCLERNVDEQACMRNSLNSITVFDSREIAIIIQVGICLIENGLSLGQTTSNAEYMACEHLANSLLNANHYEHELKRR